MRQSKFTVRLLRKLIFVGIVAIGGLYMLSFFSPRPNDLGVVNGQLAECPDSPNCVSSQTASEIHRMDPIPFSGSVAEGIEKVKAAVNKLYPRARLIAEDENYLHFEFVSLIFRFVDDVEFLVNDNKGTIEFRSASRVGHSDLGVNRRRMTKLIEEISK